MAFSEWVVMKPHDDTVDARVMAHVSGSNQSMVISSESYYVPLMQKS